jgi:tetratricopeptide (TPR) repeat protein
VKYFIGFLISLTIQGNVLAANPPGSSQRSTGAPLNMSALEAKTNREDKDAVTAFKASLAKLLNLAAKKVNSREEPVLYAQAAETLKRMAGIQFRLAHRYNTGNQAEMADYQSTLNQIVQIENKLIQKYPTSPDIARYYFLRACGLKELGKDSEAIQNLKYAIDNYPRNEDLVNEHLTLYDLLSKTKEYRTAIQYHSRITAQAAGNYYPLILNNLAFAYYYSNDIPTALHYLEMELATMPPHSDQAGDEASERTKVLKNCVLFYFTGMTNRLPNFTTHGIVPYFRGLNPGHSIGVMFKYLTNLLRAKGRDEDIEMLLKSELSSNLPYSDAIDFVLMAFENELNRRDYVHLRETGEILNRLATVQPSSVAKEKNAAEREKIFRTMGTSSLTLQQAYTKDHGTPGGDAIAASLIYIYQFLLRSADSKAKQVKLHFNIAETYFQQKKDMDLATANYMWIIDNGKTDPSVKPFYDQAQVKVILSRYEALAAKQTFPKEVVAQSMDKAQPRALPPEAAQWVGWVDKLFQEKQLESLEIFMFEASRLLYSYGQIPDAFKLISRLIQTKPNSKYSIPASSLILDTYVTSEKWDDAYRQATEFSKRLDAFKGAAPKVEFRARLQKVASDSFFKIIEIHYQNGRYLEAIRQADLFVAQYPKNFRRPEALAIAGNAALALKDKAKAMTYFTILEREKYTGKTLGTAYLTRAATGEDHLDFDSATGAYTKFLGLPPAQRELSAKDLDDVRNKNLLLTWVMANGNVPAFKLALKNPVTCSREVAANCEKLSAYAELISNGNPKNALEHWKKSHGPDRIVWSTIILQNPASIALPDKLAVLSTVPGDLEQADSMLKYSLLPYLSVSIPSFMNQVGADIRRASPLLLDKNKINARVQWIDKTELVIQKLVGISWARIRAGTLNEWANLYANFSDDMRNLPRPKNMAAEEVKSYDATVNDLITPFSKKTEELRKKALDVGMNSVIEAEVYYPITTAAYKETPTLPPDLRPERMVSSPSSLFLLAVRDAGIEINWTNSFLKAVSDKNFIKISFLIQYAQGRKLFTTPAQESVVQAESLVLAGAQAEAIEQLKTAIPLLKPPTKNEALLATALSYYGVRSKLHTKAQIEAFIASTEKEDRQNLLRAPYPVEFFEALLWSEAQVSQDIKDELSELKESNPQ